MVEIDAVLMNKLGIHARPASMLAKVALKYRCQTTLTGNNKTVDAKSMLSILTLGLKQGDPLAIRADGEEEETCVLELASLVAVGFNEE